VTIAASTAKPPRAPAWLTSGPIDSVTTTCKSIETSRNVDDVRPITSFGTTLKRYAEVITRNADEQKPARKSTA
jgi:hypothetical protein